MAKWRGEIRTRSDDSCVGFVVVEAEQEDGPGGASSQIWDIIDSRLLYLYDMESVPSGVSVSGTVAELQKVVETQVAVIKTLTGQNADVARNLIHTAALLLNSSRS